MSETLGAVVEDVGGRDERRRLEEGLEVLVLRSDVHELGQVLDPALGVDGPAAADGDLGLEHVEVAGPLEDHLDQLVRAGVRRDRSTGPRRAAASRPRIPARALPEAPPARRVAERLGEPDPRLCGERDQPPDRRVADAAPRHVEDAAQRHLVAGVGDGTQIGEHVADLAPVEETGPADHRVGDAPVGERRLERPALGVGPVEDGDVAVADALARERRVAISLVTNDRLVAVVAGSVAPDLLALAEGAPEVLFLAEQVVADDGVGGVEDRLGGAVVLVEDDRRGVGEGPLELEQVAHLGAPEAVDALVGVADDADVAPAPRRAG